MMNVLTKMKAPTPLPRHTGATRDLSHLSGMTPEQIIAKMQEDARAESKIFRIVVLEDFPDRKIRRPRKAVK